MKFHEMSEYELKSYSYGNSYAKRLYNPAKCAELVMGSSGWHGAQCSRAKGHGAKGLYCKQHAKEYPDLSAAVPLEGFVLDYTGLKIVPFSGIRTADGILRSSKGQKIDSYVFGTWDEAHKSVVDTFRQRFENALAVADRAEAEYKAALAMEEPEHGA